MKHLLILFFLVFKLSNSFSQNQYTLSGTTNFLQNGIAILIPTALTDFYFERKTNDTVRIYNHTFTFYGKLKYPSQFRLLIVNENRQYIGEPFFIDSGFQKLTMDSTTKINKTFDFGYGISIENSKTNDDYIQYFLPIFDSLNSRILLYYNEIERCDSIKDSIVKRQCKLNTERELNDIRTFRDSITLSYASKNPKSAILPFYLYELVRRYGYKDSYQKLLDQIADYCPLNISKSLERFMSDLKIKSIGRQFPLIDFINANTSEEIIKNNKYTLVEFWFSGCIPCVAQFDLLKSIYEKNKGKKFEIIAISIDGEQTIKKYNAILNSKNYPWKQILDTNGVKTALLNIEKFPTSFLLDNSGKIIKIDVSPDFLKEFLERN